MLGRGREFDQAELTNLHSWKEFDRQVSNIGKLESDVTTKAWINKTSSRMS